MDTTLLEKANKWSYERRFAERENRIRQQGIEAAIEYGRKRAKRRKIRENIFTCLLGLVEFAAIVYIIVTAFTI